MITRLVPWSEMSWVPTRERELARKEVFGEPQLLEFENLQIKLSCKS